MIKFNLFCKIKVHLIHSNDFEILFKKQSKVLVN